LALIDFRLYLDRQKPTKEMIRDLLKRCYKNGTQFGTQNGAERALEAVDAVHAVRFFLRKFSAC
jgi:hypothetical protein